MSDTVLNEELRAVIDPLLDGIILGGFVCGECILPNIQIYLKFLLHKQGYTL